MTTGLSLPILKAFPVQIRRQASVDNALSDLIGPRHPLLNSTIAIPGSHKRAVAVGAGFGNPGAQLGIEGGGRVTAVRMRGDNTKVLLHSCGYKVWHVLNCCWPSDRITTCNLGAQAGSGDC